VHPVGLYCRGYITMHGEQNVKLLVHLLRQSLFLLWKEDIMPLQ